MSCAPNGCSPCPSVMILKRNHVPFYDIFGAYPDELIMCALDRILYYAGATKIISMPTLASSSSKSSCNTPLMSCAGSSKSSLCSLFCHSKNTNCNTPRSCCPTKCKTCCTASTTSTSKTKTLTCPKDSSACSCTPSRRRTARVDFANPVCQPSSSNRYCGGKSPLADQMKSSLSMCSMACERIRNKLTESLPNCKDGNRWLWTRLINQENGCKVYEVYKDSNMNSLPNWEEDNTPVIIFLVMPNGYIMPFETLTHPVDED